MDRYERVICDIQQKTDDGRLRWVVTTPSVHARVLVDVDRVLRTFAADYTLADQHFALVFVERKSESYDETGEPFESRSFEVLVLDPDGEIVLPLYDGLVDRDDLSNLAALIEERNDRAQNFFAAFDASEVA